MSDVEEALGSAELRDTAPLDDDDDRSPASRRASSLVEEGAVLAGKYLIQKTIGSGGKGVVVAALHLGLNERVAIKLLLPDAARESGALARFEREAQALACLRSEHVARVMDVGTLESGAPYMVMELLEGSDLAAVLERRGSIAPREAVAWIVQACAGMIEAHGAGIVHRDLKPANLFLARAADGSEVVKVLDFGIAKATDGRGLVVGNRALTASSVVLGTPAYMSPEQVRAASRVDARTDVWSLGVILFELLSGRPPFDGDSPSALLAAVVADPPASLRALRPDVPEALGAVVAKCLEKDVDKRLRSAAVLRDALVEIALALDSPGSRALGRSTGSSWARTWIGVRTAEKDRAPTPAWSRVRLTAMGIGAGLFAALVVSRALHFGAEPPRVIAVESDAPPPSTAAAAALPAPPPSEPSIDSSPPSASPSTKAFASSSPAEPTPARLRPARSERQAAPPAPIASAPIPEAAPAKAPDVQAAIARRK